MAQSKKTTPAKKNSTKKTDTNKAPEQRPIRREVGGAVCLFLGIFSIIGYFDIDAWFINIFCGLAKGFIGWGYYIFPPALLLCAWILALHRGRPVRGRVISALLLPVLLGALLHMFMCKEGYEFESGIISSLFESGKAMTSGGLASGSAAMLFEAMFSIYGATPVFVVTMLFCALYTFDLSVSTITEYFKNRQIIEYEPEPEPEPLPPRIQEKLPQRRKKSPINIPLDGEEMQEDEDVEDGEIFPINKRSFFNSSPRVPTPDQVAARPNEMLNRIDINADEPESEDDDEPVTLIRESEIEESESFIKPPEQEPEFFEPVAQEISSQPYTPKKRLKADELAAETESIAQSIESETSVVRGEYEFPPMRLLQPGSVTENDGSEEIAANRGRIESALRSFGVSASIVNVTRGPSVTRYDLELDTGVKLNKLTGLADDLALSLGVSGVRIAPIPNRISTVGIEVPNKTVSTVYLRDIVGSPEFSGAKSRLSFAIGKDISGNTIVGDISKLPHLLIAGTTGSGKSVCVNSMILSLLYKSTPDEVRFIMIDPKMVEFVVYNEIPHLYIPVVTDPKKAAGALQWVVVEMMKRYRLFSEAGARDLAGYNRILKRNGEDTLPQVVVIIDELADLMIAAAKEVEESICRVAQMGRASGMHLVIATQRPSADVITGLMKANIPSRIALFVRSAMDSRIILDMQGAEKLVGNGDMLYLPVGAGKALRVQGAWVSDEERESVVSFVKSKGESRYSEEIIEEIDRVSEDKKDKPESEGIDAAYDELLPDAVDVIFDTKQASVSMLQRRLKLGYARAARIVDQMEELGVVGPSEGSKPRQILISRDQWRSMQLINGTAPIGSGMADNDYDDEPPFDMEDDADISENTADLDEQDE